MTSAAHQIQEHQRATEPAWPPLLMRRPQAAYYLGISETTFDRWIADRRAPAGNLVGGVRIWHRDDLAAAADRLFNRAGTTGAGGNPWDQP